MKKLFYILLSLLPIALFAQEELETTIDTAIMAPMQIKPIGTDTYEDLNRVHSQLDLQDPNNVQTTIEYDPVYNCYVLRTRIGETEIATPYMMTETEYRAYSERQQMGLFWREKISEVEHDNERKFDITDMKFNIGPADKIFGPGGVQVKLQGSAELLFGFKHQFVDNPSLTQRARTNNIFDFDEIQTMFSGDDPIRFTDLGNKKCAVFLNVSDTDRALDTLVNVFYTQLFQILCKQADSTDEGRLKVPVRVFLDDFATNVYIENFDKLISVIRSREICVSVILQSISQLDSVYNKSQALTIINNCDHVIYLGGSDLQTAEYMAARMCKPTESILCMPNEEILLLTRGKKGEQVSRVKPYSCFDEGHDDNEIK